MPAGPVYLVKPSRIAVIAAFLTASGVSKSGSPAAKLMTPTPVRPNCRARSSMPIVIDGVMARTVSERYLGATSRVLAMKRYSSWAGPPPARRRPAADPLAVRDPQAAATRASPTRPAGYRRITASTTSRVPAAACHGHPVGEPVAYSLG